MSDKETKAEHYFSANPQSRSKYGLIQTSLRGKRFQFVTASGVFSKKRLDTGTRLLIETMLLPKKGLVLDVGCGYGAVGIAAACFNPALCVVMTDVNKRAIGLARENIKRNTAVNAEVRLGHLYEPVAGLRFDCVLSNPPVSAGMETVAALITNGSEVLSSRGSMQIVVKSRVGWKTLHSVFESVFGNCRVVDRQSGYRVLMGEKQ